MLTIKRLLKSLSVFISLFLVVLAVSSTTAQMMPPGMPGMGPGYMGQPQGAGNDIGKAVDDVRKIAQRILERVSTNNPLQQQDIETIRQVLEQGSKFHGRLEKPDRAYLFMIESYIAYYTDKKEEAIKDIQRAEQMAPNMPDVSDSVITLALMYEDYDMVKSALRRRGVDQAVQQRSRAISEWTNPAGQYSQPQTYPDGMGGGQQGVLKLPVNAMAPKYLGESIGSLKVRTLNGTYFLYEPGSGPLFCAILWNAPQTSTPGSEYSQPQYYQQPAPPGYDMMGMPGMMPGQAAPTVVIPPIAFDLPTNMQQFKDIFKIGMMSGKITTLGINMDKGPMGRQAALTVITENAWPWPHCSIDDLGAQWEIVPTTLPVMVLADANGKICYIGPVGGYLPQMLLMRELMKAQVAAMGMPDLPSSSKEPGSTHKGLIGRLFGGGASNKETTKEAEESATPAQSPPERQTSVPVTKQSNPQAQQMYQTAMLKSRTMGKRSACNMCDDLIERFPDALEADQARMLIKDLCSSDPRLAKERADEGKYTGIEN
ncbi:MAG: hypothetical protein JW709_07310 [Sedimentisphaerales bacterium]|nr:hypothetical protein [Sedimentisphaerales bacterium]